jgi:hypothetical protein
MPNTSFKLDKEKYLNILKSQSSQAALTQLHRDTDGWEFQAFEGKGGWQPKTWEALAEVRRFSREIWEKQHNP